MSLSSNDIIKLIIGLIGGLGIFLYGINLMGEALKALAGDKMKTVIEKLTNNVFMGILVGFVVTAIIQSSSGTTALSISLIRAGLMSMPQAIGIIMGANIGTTATAFLFSFPKISEYSLLFIGIGAILIFFIKKKKMNTIGQAILGFGLLFYGMEMMGEGLKSLAETDMFKDIMLQFSDSPFLGLLTGMLVTAIVQSSSATTGIVQSLYQSGAIDLHGALPILFGNNIGTTITAVIAAIGGSIAAKRASAFHVFFNVFGALLFLALLSPFYSLIVHISEATGATPKLQIAYAHLIFNVSNTLLIVWFVKQIVWLIKKIIPGKDDFDDGFNFTFDDRLIEESPILALESSKQAILHMASFVRKMLDDTIAYSKDQNPKLLEESQQIEMIINTLDHKTHEYLVKIAPHIDTDHSKTLSIYLDTIRDLERIGDHCENLTELFEYIKENKGYLSEDAIEDLNLMFVTVSSMLDKCLIIIDSNNKKLSEEVIETEETVDRMEKKSRKRHTIRVNDGICTSDIGIHYIELLSNLERIGDHCNNIAEYSLNDEYYSVLDEEEIDIKKIIQEKEKLKINIKPIEREKGQK